LLVEQHVKTGRVTALLPEPGEEPAVCVVDAAALRALRERRTSGSSDGTLLATLQNFGATIGFFTPEDLNEALVVRTRIHLAAAIAEARARILEQHMLAGVTVEDPSSAYIDAGVTIGQDTVIRPTTFLEAGTVIGEGCEIGPCARIANCTLGDRVSVQNAVLADSTVGDDTRIGPFAQLRPGSRVGRKVKIGNFVELKKAEVEDRVSLGHFAYMGDVFVGEKTNIGAGTITCNYDGKHKHVTRIGRNAFIGSNATLVAPVEIGEGGFVAAGSVVTEAVPDDALALGRARQINKPEWAKKRRERE
ncbi:MAG: UDP-N-acetylglucosamine pyrophosphorylase/glucosamine-phosphate N-acetyltransferase, partial [Armatimonadetes bacterium]|nr:UDP-N-acetylglucosamine pyrophosphorylase/glucosamine-phosphate N-acetyltransferase [Armatimonadota bacterium]